MGVQGKGMHGFCLIYTMQTIRNDKEISLYFPCHSCISCSPAGVNILFCFIHTARLICVSPHSEWSSLRSTNALQLMLYTQAKQQEMTRDFFHLLIFSLHFLHACRCERIVFLCTPLRWLACHLKLAWSNQPIGSTNWVVLTTLCGPVLPPFATDWSMNYGSVWLAGPGSGSPGAMEHGLAL